MGVRFPDQRALKRWRSWNSEKEMEAHASNAQKKNGEYKEKNVIAKMCGEFEIKIHARVR